MKNKKRKVVFLLHVLIVTKLHNLKLKKNISQGNSENKVFPCL